MFTFLAGRSVLLTLVKLLQSILSPRQLLNDNGSIKTTIHVVAST